MLPLISINISLVWSQVKYLVCLSVFNILQLHKFVKRNDEIYKSYRRSKSHETRPELTDIDTTWTDHDQGQNIQTTDCVAISFILSAMAHSGDLAFCSNCSNYIKHNIHGIVFRRVKWMSEVDLNVTTSLQLNRD